MNPRKPARRCVICGASYHIKGSAKTCGALECRAEVTKQRHARFRAANRDKVRESYANWRRANPTYLKDYMRRLRARKRNAAPPSH